MNLQPRGFLFLLVLSAALAVPAFGQGAASVPDFSGPDFTGMWVHPYFPGIEPPPSGPGPVYNRSRRANGAGNNQQFVGDYTNPILKPDAAATVKRLGEISQSRLTYPTPSNRCWPSGVPYIFFQPGMEMLRKPNEIVFIYLRNHEFRHVRLNEPHPAKVTPSWYGDSVGHYEGDTLVIDTVGIKVGPFAMVDMYGTPFTEKLHVVERYRLVDYDEANDAIERNRKENFEPPGYGGAPYDPNDRGKVLQLHFTVEDPGVFTTPWTSTITYRRSTGPWTELICAENRREYYADRDSEVPHADRP